MEQQEQQPDGGLPGAWRKVSSGECAAGYAASLRIEAGGLYFGQTDPPGGFTWWDGGSWQITAPGRLALSTANDAVVIYRYELNGDVLELLDAAGCRFSYRRIV